MNEVKAAVHVFATEAERVDIEWAWDERFDDGIKRGMECGDLRLGEFVRERQVAAELVHHVGISPLEQERILFGGESRGAAAGHLGLGHGGAERVERADGIGGEPVEIARVAGGNEGEEAAQLRQFEAVERNWRGEVAMGCEGGHKVSLRPAIGEAERWFDRGVKAVSAWGLGDVVPRCGKSVDVRWRDMLTGGQVPAEPGGAEIGEITRGRDIYGVAVKFHARRFAVNSNSSQVMVP